LRELFANNCSNFVIRVLKSFNQCFADILTKFGMMFIKSYGKGDPFQANGRVDIMSPETETTLANKATEANNISKQKICLSTHCFHRRG